jgi:hypothetical protein
LVQVNSQVDACLFRISWRRLMKVDRNKEFNDKVQKFIL